MKSTAPLSRTDAEHIRRLSTATKREAHRLATETAATIDREVANRTIRIGNGKLSEFLFPLGSQLPKKIVGLKASVACVTCRDALGEACEKFCEWIRQQIAA